MTFYAKIAFSDFVAAGGIVFHEHISFNLKLAPVCTLEDFFQIAKIVRQSRQNSIAFWMTSRYSIDSK